MDSKVVTSQIEKEYSAK
jgi:hypothetical protein